MKKLIPWILIFGLTAVFTVMTSLHSLDRYREFRSGWSWDLAYYNQWFWSLNFGDGLITVSPAGPWTNEGPSIWRMNYLAPIRFLIAPIYRVFPDPTTLLVINCIAVSLTIPAAYSLTRSESGSTRLALATAALVPFTPLLYPLAINDFRELQLALPVILWAVQGVRSRCIWLTAVSFAGLLACRQEFGFIIASFALLPPKHIEPVNRRYAWALACTLTGAGWIVFAFLGYLRWCVNGSAFEIFMTEFSSGKVPVMQVLGTAVSFLILGTGAWIVPACLNPRVALLAFPWVWSMSNGRFAMSHLEIEPWHHVRYTVPMVGLVLASGCIGVARLSIWMKARPNLLAACWLLAAVGLIVPFSIVQSQLARIPRLVPEDEIADVRRWITRVSPEEGVLAHYDVTAPLSSRRLLFSYLLNANKPLDYPILPPEVSWSFIRKLNVGEATTLPDHQGFDIVHDGPRMEVWRRREPAILTSPPRSARAMISGLLINASSKSSPVTFTFFETESPLLYFFGSCFLLLEKLLRLAGMLAPGVVFILWARRQERLARAIDPATRGISGEQAARSLLQSYRGDILILDIGDDRFSDEFDPVANQVRLSHDTANAHMLREIIIVSHVAAHAVMFQQGDHFGRLRMPLIFAIRICTAAGWLLAIGSLMIGSWQLLEAAALVLSAAIVVPSLVLLALERRATPVVWRFLFDSGLIREEERAAAALIANAQAARHASRAFFPRRSLARRRLD